MKKFRTLYNKKGLRRSDPDRYQFALFVVGAVAVLALVFVLGIQAGRVIERRAHRSGGPGGSSAAAGIVPGRIENAAVRDVSREMAAYSEEASRVPPAPAQSARERLEETEKSVTFPATLAGKAPAPVPLGPGTAALDKAGAHGGYLVQAGAFRERSGADALLARASKVGFKGSVAESRGAKGRVVYRVLIGPYATRGEADNAARAIKRRLGVGAFVPRG